MLRELMSNISLIFSHSKYEKLFFYRRKKEIKKDKKLINILIFMCFISV